MPQIVTSERRKGDSRLFLSPQSRVWRTVTRELRSCIQEEGSNAGDLTSPCTNLNSLQVHASMGSLFTEIYPRSIGSIFAQNTSRAMAE